MAEEKKDLRKVKQVWLHQDVAWVGVFPPTKNLHDGKFIKHQGQKTRPSIKITSSLDLVIENTDGTKAVIPSANVALAILE